MSKNTGKQGHKSPSTGGREYPPEEVGDKVGSGSRHAMVGMGAPPEGSEGVGIAGLDLSETPTPTPGQQGAKPRTSIRDNIILPPDQQRERLRPLAPKPPTNRRLTYTRSAYDRLLTLYREIGVNHQAVARESGWHWTACQRAYSKGWKLYKWARPIRLVLEEDAAEAKYGARRKAEQERKEIAAKAAVAKTKFEEAVLLEEQVINAARKNIAAAYGITASLVPAVAAAANYIRETLCVRVVDVTGEKWVPKTSAQLKADKVNVEFALRLFDKHSVVLQRVSSTASGVIELGRLTRGQPTQITEERHTLELSPEDAMREIEQQEEALRLIRLESDVLRAARSSERKSHKKKLLPVLEAHGEDVTDEDGEEDDESDPDPELEGAEEEDLTFGPDDDDEFFVQGEWPTP